MDCHIEIFINGRWISAADFEPNPQTLDRGVGGGGRLQYDAVLRIGDQVSLSPLFDFAPMFLDPEGIGRVSRWDDERPGGQPEWATICEKFGDLMAPGETRRWLAGLGKKVARLPDVMQRQQVDVDIIQRLAAWIEEVAAGLAEARPRTLI